MLARGACRLALVTLSRFSFRVAAMDDRQFIFFSGVGHRLGSAPQQPGSSSGDMYAPHAEQPRRHMSDLAQRLQNCIDVITSWQAAVEDDDFDEVVASVQIAWVLALTSGHLTELAVITYEKEFDNLKVQWAKMLAAAQIGISSSQQNDKPTVVDSDEEVAPPVDMDTLAELDTFLGTGMEPEPRPAAPQKRRRINQKTFDWDAVME